MRRFLVFILAFIFCFSLSSCKKEKEKNNQIEILKGYFSSELSVVSKDGKLSFQLSEGKITVDSPKILKGTEFIITDDKISAKLSGLGNFEVDLPESFISYMYSLKNTVESVKSESFQLKNGIAFFDECSIHIESDHLIFKTENKEFIITKRTEENDKQSQSSKKSFSND